MCFSATGSFAAAGFLSGIGAAAVAQNIAPRQRLLASVPLLFAAQQAVEGVVWLTIGDGRFPALHDGAVSMFLFFALVLWPIWTPLALLRVEDDPARRRTLRVLLGAGLGVGAYAAVFLWRHPPWAEVADQCIRYDYASDGTALHPGLRLLGYAIPTLGPLFVSSLRGARGFGVAVIVSLAVTVVVKDRALASVWCFFAALLSSVILLGLMRQRRLVPVPARV